MAIFGSLSLLENIGIWVDLDRVLVVTCESQLLTASIFVGFWTQLNRTSSKFHTLAIPVGSLPIPAYLKK